nr:G-type lectin S-receptor-like serine/threonine-protein kinase At4g27290 isoform X2 [Ipomoea batatas]
MNFFVMLSCLLVPISLLNTPFSHGVETISGNKYITQATTISSPNGRFELGFFRPGESLNYYVGIWYKNISPQTVVWIANRVTPISSSAIKSSKLRVLDGDLVLVDGAQNLVWSTNLSASSVTKVKQNSVLATLRDSGNLVLINDGINSTTPLWQSFDHPTHTLLPGAKFGYNKRTKTTYGLTSWKSFDDPAPGLYKVVSNGDMSFEMWNGTEEYWNSGPKFGTGDLKPNPASFNFTIVDNENETYFIYNLLQPSVLRRFIIDVNGQDKTLTWSEAAQEWMQTYVTPRQQCDVYAYCGPFGICNHNSTTVCVCLQGFKYKSDKEWRLNEFSGGCVRNTSLKCGTNYQEEDMDMFIMYPNVRLPRHPQNITTETQAECESTCLKNCSCTAYTYSNTRGHCWIWVGQLLNLKQLGKDGINGSTIYIRLAATEFSNIKDTNSKQLLGKLKAIIASVAVAAGTLVACTIFCVCYKRRRAALKIRGRAWKLWNEGNAMDLLDDSLLECCKECEVLKGINVGLLCVEEDPNRRPSMPNNLKQFDGNGSTIYIRLAASEFSNLKDTNSKQLLGKLKAIIPSVAVAAAALVACTIFCVCYKRRRAALKIAELAVDAIMDATIDEAWKLWNEGNAMDLLDDSVLVECCKECEVLKCINVGLLCVEEDPNLRPSMPKALLMLTDESMNLPKPNQPAFVTRNRICNDSSTLESDKPCSNQLTFSAQEGRVIVISLLNTPFSHGVETISRNKYITQSTTISSPNGIFELGFFRPGESLNYYVGIWYKNISPQTVVWVANRVTPIPSSAIKSSKLRVLDGDLVLVDGAQNLVWSTNLSVTRVKQNSVLATLGDSGNLVLIDDGTPLWQSFDHPTDTFLPGAKLGYNKRTKTTYGFTSWKSWDDPAPGLYSLVVNNGDVAVSLWNRTEEYERKPKYGTGNLKPNPASFNFTFVDNQNETYFTYNSLQPSALGRFIIDVNGQGESLTWSESTHEWMLTHVHPPQPCDVYAYCGPFGICNDNSTNVCVCLQGFKYNSEREWKLNEFSGGCVRKTRLKCETNYQEEETDRFIIYPNVRLPRHPQNIITQTRAECESTCLNNCSCTAYAYSNSRGHCWIWVGQLLNLKQLGEDEINGSTIYVRLAAPEFSNIKDTNSKQLPGELKAIIASVAVAAAALVACTIFCFCFKRRRAELKITGNIMDLVDDSLLKCCKESEVLKCINVGLLCVEEDPNVRPSMPSVLLMLSDESTVLPQPNQPAFVTRKHTSIECGIIIESDKPCSNQLTFSTQEGR